MTDRLDRIEAGLESTAAICGSNARAIQATGEQIGELRNTVEAFIQKLDEEGLRVTLVTEVVDDTADDVAHLERQTNRQDVSITTLRQDAIADRQAFREQAEADRQAFREALEADRAEARQHFDAMQENIQQLFRELIRTNRRVDNLEQAS